MAETSTNMQLTRWTSGTDKFDYKQLAENFKIIDEHDHGASGGVQISSAGIATDAVQSNHIAPGAVTAAKIDSGAITSSSIGTNQIGNTQLDLTNVNEARTTIPTGTIEDGYTFDYTNSTLSFTWRLRYVEKAGFNSGTGTWVFVGGTPKSYVNDAEIWMDDSIVSNVSAGKSLGVTGMSLPAGKYLIRYDALLDFKYQNDPSAEMRLWLYNAGSPLSNTVIAPPLGAATQLMVPATKIDIQTFSSTASLSMEAVTKFRQITDTNSTTDPKASHVYRVGVTAIPIYITAT